MVLLTDLVWFDAPIGYLSITAGENPDWELWWKRQKDYEVELHQFMGKDNVPFHSVIFPCTLLGTDDDWNLVNSLHTTEYLNYEDDKFSKSRGVGVFGSMVKTTGIPVDVWRYYLFAVRPETGDTVFQWSDLIARNNNELLANVGNFVNRVMKFTCHAEKYNSVVPDFEIDDSFVKEMTENTVEFIDLMEKCQIKQALMKLMAISSRGNQYLQENDMKNALYENERAKCNQVVGMALNLIHLLASLVQPFMPTSSQNILNQLQMPLKPLNNSSFIVEIKGGHNLGKPGYLFSRIDSKKAEEFKIKFGGKKEEKVKKKKKSKSKDKVTSEETK
eukprot:NODE_305_length_10201_cov_0.856464.p4 type:complete len:332 gc:universal NODE_305_length_10201_cov_0.856464:7142-6147(-)